jgi:diguanylate cyclase (GGDEF)-like protein/PAS domain S-box-containing protein
MNFAPDGASVPANALQTSVSIQNSLSPEELRGALIEAAFGVVWRSAPDLSVIEAWGWKEATGQSETAYQNDGWLEAVHPEDREEVLATMEDGRRTGRPCEGVYRARQSDGQYRWVRARAVPLRDETGPIREWVGHLVDVHEKIEADAALRAAEERLRLALESSAVGVWDYDYRTQKGWWSESKRAVLGLPHDYPITQDSFLALVHPEDRPELEARIERAKQLASNGRFEARFRVRRYGGLEEVWIESTGQVFFDAAGRPERILGTMRDVTEKRLAMRKLNQLARFDQLTGLANRAHLIERLEESFALLGRGAAVLLLDLDGFKNVNDTAGHHAGDLVLQAAARRLTDALPRGAVAGRWGGDEFAVVVPQHAGAKTGAQIVADIQKAFEKPFSLLRRQVFLGASVGYALAPEHGATAEDLLLNADLALHHAKADGRGLSRMFTPALKEQAEARIDLEADLRRGFAASEFELHYQPQVAMADGAIVGAEALLRWRHPEKGLLSPAAFLSVLKTSAIASAVGTWTVRTACQWAARCLRAGRPIRVAVNLFSAQFRAGDLLETVRRCLQESRLPPELLELEITEKIILIGDPRLVETLHGLRALGVGLSFDDYGTGYASLSMLTEFPLTRLKIDKSFVQNIGNPGHSAVVKAVIDLGHAFKMEVIAEGIETPDQAKKVSLLGCDKGQGYLFGRPVSADEFLRKLGILQCPPESSDHWPARLA